MARLAAAGCLVWAVLLTSGVLAAAGGSPPDLFSSWFPSRSLPPPVRLYSKQNGTVNAAASGGKVVFVNSDCKDFYQKWYVLPSPPSLCDASSLKYFFDSFGVKPFVLVNAKTFEVMAIPEEAGTRPVTLKPLDWYSINNELWIPGKPYYDSGFYQLFVHPNKDRSLNGLGGAVRERTVVGVYPPNPVTPNTLWKLEPYPYCYP